MGCKHPLTAWRTRSGEMTFKQGQGVGSSLQLPCGQCIGCRIDRTQQWATRCIHESKNHADNCFITLTYADSQLPRDGGLNKSHFQLFIKRLRKYAKLPIRYFHCGEYGDKLERPHYHCLLFGYDFLDKQLFKRGEYPLYTSDILTRLWGHGHCLIGALTYDSAAYTARYIMKKITGTKALIHYQKVNTETGEICSIQPEYITMSLKPAIGKTFFEKYKSDCYPSDFLIVDGKKRPLPKYFDKLMDKINPEMLAEVKLKRVRNASKHKADQTFERLAVQEKVMLASLSKLSRHKEI